MLHELLVELFRNRGELAPELLRLCARLELGYERVEQRTIDLSQVVSTQYRADSVIELRGPGGAIVGAVVVEVQLGIDAGKRDSWPLYVTALRSRLRCPVTLLVVTTRREVARWARQPIEIGHPGFHLEPLVVDYGDIPRIIDPDQARRLPELAVLSMMAHPELEVAIAAVDAIEGLPEDQNRLYLDIILAKLPAPIRQILEARMRGYQYQSEFARSYYKQGLEQGLERGLEQGREQGLEQGRTVGRGEGREQGLQDAALVLLRAKLEAVDPEDEAAIRALHDERALTRLIDALARAHDERAARGALVAARTEGAPALGTR
ncbi:MAG TPA: hypothetical protein VFT22_02940 [Kofleriaceae bacterium]|nr:hypothetical protein [Kofleriaceae bacterium]